MTEIHFPPPPLLLIVTDSDCRCLTAVWLSRLWQSIQLEKQQVTIETRWGYLCDQLYTVYTNSIQPQHAHCIDVWKTPDGPDTPVHHLSMSTRCSHTIYGLSLNHSIDLSIWNLFLTSSITVFHVSTTILDPITLGSQLYPSLAPQWSTSLKNL